LTDKSNVCIHYLLCLKSQITTSAPCFACKKQS